jgi:hypothetical protein
MTLHRLVFRQRYDGGLWRASVLGVADIRTGSSGRSGAVLIVGGFYAVPGIACYLYSGRQPFWVLFLFQGVIVIGTTLILRSLRDQRGSL